MKKTNNKGFSLVELIIVIAIMAILAGAIAPALIRYIDKSRKSNDVSSAKTIKTAVETALGNESVYEFLTTGDAATAGKFCTITITPGKATGDAATGATKCIAISGAYSGSEMINGKTAAELMVIAQNEIGTNIGEKTPKLKYKKAADSKVGTPKSFVAAISGKGTVYVFIATGDTITLTEKDGEVISTDAYQLCPTVCDEYQ